MYCKYCGKQIADDSEFCQFCGRNIKTKDVITTEKEKDDIIKQNNDSSIKGHLGDKPKGPATKPLSSIFDGIPQPRYKRFVFTPTPELLDFYSKEEPFSDIQPPKKPQHIPIREKTLWLKQLSLEQRAAVKEENGCLLGVLSFIIWLIPGFIYRFKQDFLFNYDKIGPIEGLFIFIGIGIVFSIIIEIIHGIYWKEYNKIIADANEELKKIIDKGEGDPNDLSRIKKQFIERKLDHNKSLTEEEFMWHTSRYCWSCGKKHSTPPIPFLFRTSYEKTWKEGVYRRYRTYRTEAYILLCPDCEHELSQFNTRGNGIMPSTKWNFHKIPYIEKWLTEVKKTDFFKE